MNYENVFNDSPCIVRVLVFVQITISEVLCRLVFRRRCVTVVGRSFYRFAYACHAQNRSVIFQISNGSQTDIQETLGGGGGDEFETFSGSIPLHVHVNHVVHQG